MPIITKVGNCKFIRFSYQLKSREIGRVYLYIMYNSLHKRPFGFIEDVFIEEEYQKKGFWSQLEKELVATARKEKCYKLIANSRFSRENVHKIYEHIGFKKRGFEFRMDL